MKWKVIVMLDDKKIRVKYFCTKTSVNEFIDKENKRNFNSSLYIYVIEEIKGDE